MAREKIFKFTARHIDFLTDYLLQYFEKIGKKVIYIFLSMLSSGEIKQVDSFFCINNI